MNAARLLSNAVLSFEFQRPTLMTQFGHWVGGFAPQIYLPRGQLGLDICGLDCGPPVADFGLL
jgi:hypothetical protein